MTRDTIRIAMWSGPRNISTALMRAFENRGDCAVCDEPFYACFLTHSGLNHPGRDEVIAQHETDSRRVVKFLTGPVPNGKPVFYQKHMAHHLTPEIDTAWIDQMTNCFLVRDPRSMLVSLAKVLPEVTIEDTGLPQQLEIYRHVRSGSQTEPVVLDSTDVLLDPRGVLGRLCERLGIVFDEAMLSWPAGPRATDGVWAKHWYQSVLRSTGFAPYRPKAEILPDGLGGLLAECREIYRELYKRRLTA